MTASGPPTELRARHRGADGGMPYQYPEVHVRPAAAQHAHVFGEGLEPSIDAGAQGIEGHAFDNREVAHDHLAQWRRARHDAETAIAHDRRRDPERGRRVPPWPTPFSTGSSIAPIVSISKGHRCARAADRASRAFSNFSAASNRQRQHAHGLLPGRVLSPHPLRCAGTPMSPARAPAYLTRESRSNRSVRATGAGNAFVVEFVSD
jgi:hypothetical protein